MPVHDPRQQAQPLAFPESRLPSPLSGGSLLSDTERTAWEVIELVFGPQDEWTFAIRLWSGSTRRPVTGMPAFTIVFPHAWSLRATLLPPSELKLGEAFVHGELDIEGDIEAASDLLEPIRHRLARPRAVVRLISLLLHLPGRPTDAEFENDEDRKGRVRKASLFKHSLSRDAAAIRSHYDVGNEFYALWLDPNLVYSCAYFPTVETSLADAQIAKFDLICRKLRLLPGERLLDIGCGWGGLIRHATKHYGVIARGITLSPEQASLARERIRAEGLEDRCQVDVQDYREVPGKAIFDKVVSVGMVEHVGRRHLHEYFGTSFRLLKPGGLMLSHGIVEAGRAQARSWFGEIGDLLWRRGKFIDRYVFPDGELVPLGTMVAEGEHAGFEVRDAESLREHYARTLRYWVAGLQGAWDRAVELAGAEIARTWRLYMSASAQGFASGRLNVVQLLLGKPDEEGNVHVPMTRVDVYAGV